MRYKGISNNKNLKSSVSDPDPFNFGQPDQFHETIP